MSSVSTLDQCTVFYDGRCNFCKRAKGFTERNDQGKHFKFVDLWTHNDNGVVQKSDLIKEIHVVTEGGNVYKGYEAIEFILLNLPIFTPIKFLVKMTFFQRIGNPVYQFIAKNREVL